MKKHIVIISVTILVGLQFFFMYQEYQLKNNSPDIPEKMYAGQVHYSRIPVQYWEHRIKMIKAMGLNALSVYIMWNYHEIAPGVFDYETGNRNLPLFLDLAEKYQMKVLFRPGPYVCAQWDFGGLPARLLAMEGLQIRANNELFLNQVQKYFSSLVQIINSHQYTDQNPSGSIVLLQIQNQYGFYGTDKAYIEALRKMWTDLGVNVPQYYVDWIQNIQKCHWDGANIGINNGITQTQWNFVRTFQKKGYLLGGEIYSGWLTHWSEQWQQKSLDKNQQQYGFLMYHNHSYSMYMVHGGTNFGLTAGANAFIGQKENYKAHITSYDYDAPINQQGSKTAKYQGLRNLIKQYADWKIPDIPQPIDTMVLQPFIPTSVGSLSPSVGNPTISNSNKPYPFESNELKMFNQGIVVYETYLTERTYFFKARIHDFAIVQIDGEYVTTLDRSVQFQHNFKATCKKQNCTMRIIVEALGHINFDHQMQNDYKGLIDIDDDLETQFYWNMYKVPIDKSIFNWNKKSSNINQTTLLKATITLDRVPADTYLDMSNFQKGYVWVNGHNLGRYWSKGPQKRLFCPGVWMKQGDNEIYVLELLYDQKKNTILSRDTLKESPIKDI